LLKTATGDGKKKKEKGKTTPFGAKKNSTKRAVPFQPFVRHEEKHKS